MKQLLFMMALTLGAGYGTLYHPFWGLLLYYAFAVLRPQWLWAWALPLDARWSLMAAGLVLLGVILHPDKLELFRRYNGTQWLLLAFGLCLLGSLLNAAFPGEAMHWGIEYAKVLLIALIGCLVLTRLWQIEAMALMILIVLGYLAWHINSLYLFQGRLDVFHVGFGGLDNNGAGLMIAMGAPFAYAFAVASPRRWQRGLAVVAGLLILHAVMMTYSRGAMLASVLGLGWLLLHHRQRVQALLIALTLMAAVTVLAGPEIRQRFLSTSEYAQDGSAQLRFDSWRAGWAIALDHPLTGLGIRNSNRIIHNYGGDHKGRTIHSQFIQIAADSGLVAIGVYLALLGLSVVNCRRTRKLIDAHQAHAPPDDASRDRLGRLRAIALGCECSMIIFIIGAAFLSMEVFELPWLLMVICGAMPYAVERYLAAQTAGSDGGDAPEGAAGPIKRPCPEQPCPPWHTPERHGGDPKASPSGGSWPTTSPSITEGAS